MKMCRGSCYQQPQWLFPANPFEQGTARTRRLIFDLPSGHGFRDVRIQFVEDEGEVSLCPAESDHDPEVIESVLDVFSGMYGATFS